MQIGQCQSISSVQSSKSSTAGCISLGSGAQHPVLFDKVIRYSVFTDVILVAEKSKVRGSNLSGVGAFFQYTKVPTPRLPGGTIRCGSRA